MERPEGYPISDEQLELPEMNSSIESTLFDRNDYCNGLSILESGRYRRTYSDMGDDHHRILERAKTLGKLSFDPRLLVLVEFFRQFYVRRQELLKKIYPGLLQKEFMEFFRKIGVALAEVKSNQMQVKTMQRSLSLGSPRTPSNKGDESPLRLERFKIRTVTIGGDEVQEGGQGGQGGQGPSKPSGFK